MVTSLSTGCPGAVAIQVIKSATTAGSNDSRSSVRSVGDRRSSGWKVPQLVLGV